MNWQKIYSDALEHRVHIVRDVLKDHGINSVIVNKKNSALNNFGLFELQVTPDNVIQAIKIITDDISFK
jgi:hypothetical protein